MKNTVPENVIIMISIYQSVVYESRKISLWAYQEITLF